MKPKDIVTIAGIKYEVGEDLGSGGQGTVWKAKSLADKRIYAIKILKEKNSDVCKNKVDNIRNLVTAQMNKVMAEAVAKGSVQGIKHDCPFGQFADPDTQEPGYVMDYAPGDKLSRLLDKNVIRKMPTERKLNLLKKVTALIERLHTMGYCYTDISLDNFIYDEKADVMHLIDCENMACKSYIDVGVCDFLIGTGFFIAPEVAFRRAKVGYDSDNYALATLIFRILTENALLSAYHGIAMYSTTYACESMLEVAGYDADDDIDKNWRKFVFDPKDRSNGLDNLCLQSKNPNNKAFRKEIEEAIGAWSKLDPRLKDAFLTTFRDPFDTSARLSASMWVNVINSVLTEPTPKSLWGSGFFVKQTVSKGPADPLKPYLISTKGLMQAITEKEVTIDGKALGLAQGALGTLKRDRNGYLFTSQLLCYIDVLDAKGNVRCKVSNGQRVNLCDGESLLPVISTISVKLVC